MRYKRKKFNFKNYYTSPNELSFEDIKIRKFDNDFPDIEKYEIGNWIDLRCYKIDEIYGKNFNKIDEPGSLLPKSTVKIWKGFTYVINLGVCIKLPEKYEAHVLPRSSTFKNTGLLLANSEGIIDNSYCGNDDIWKAYFYSTRSTLLDLSEFPRLLQFRIQKIMPKLRFNYIESLSDNSRGGFGTTGLV